MGQRSQIYISFDIKASDTTNERIKGLVARYYQWNFGERMVSRARSIIEKLHDEYLSYPYQFQMEYKKLCRFCDANFDMRDIVISSDILQEIQENWTYDFEHGHPENVGEMDGLFNQDNNDGQLYISVTEDGIKYCFSEFKGKRLMDAGAYMRWNRGKSWASLDAEKLEADEIRYTQDNIKAIKEMATLMTPEEVEVFLDTAQYREFVGNPERRITYTPST